MPAAADRVSRASLLALALLVLAASGAQQWWQGEQERRLGRALAAAAQPGDIRLVSSQTCPFCDHARAWLAGHGVRFEECFIERDAACGALYAATGARGTPTLVVAGQAQLGFDAARVLGSLALKPRG
jgi:glutaredoxin